MFNKNLLIGWATTDSLGLEQTTLVVSPLAPIILYLQTAQLWLKDPQLCFGQQSARLYRTQ